MKAFAQALSTSVARTIAATCVAGFVTTAHTAYAGTNAEPDLRCLAASGEAAASCVGQYIAAVSACRNDADAGCEAALRAPGGALAALLAGTEEPVRRNCTAEAADRLTFLLGLDDLVLRTAQACRKWGEEVVAVTYASDLAGLAPEVLACQRVVGARLAGLHDEVVQAYGPGCYLGEAGGSPCDRPRRDQSVTEARAAAGADIEQACGPAFDTLGLVPVPASPMRTGRIDALMEIVAGRARHLAQRVFPPLGLGSTGLFGPYPVGVRTFELVDASRLNVAGTEPRPVKVEVYYPSTLEAAAGVPRESVQILGMVDLFLTPTYRGVARAPGTFPLVLFSPGAGSDPWAYVYLAAHLASHGFLIATVEHHGSHFFDTRDPDTLVNRPLDLRVLLDQLLAFSTEPGSFFEGAIDADRIGAAGHSLGGYTVLALAACPFSLGAFTDPRVKAILPIEGSAQFFASHAPGIFSTIRVPTLLIGGSLSRLALLLQPAFDALTPGPTVLAYANLIDAFHNTFTDRCEIPDAILAGFLGGPPDHCEPVALPWRYARHITNYLAFNFFDATLNGNGEALARLDPALLAGIAEMVFQRQPAPCTGDCDGDGSVTVDELVTGIDIAMDSRSLDVCLAFDAGADRRVTVDELLAGVHDALTGCRIEEMPHQSAAGGLRPGDSGSATCPLPCGDGIVESREACDPPGEQGVCAPGDVCNPNCTACVNCTDATVIAPDGGVFVGTTAGGTPGLASSCGDDIFAPERLFRWTPSVSHLATIQTCGGTTNYRTTLYVREGTCLGADLACNQRACGEHSRVTLPVVAGTTYFIVVDGSVGDAGNFTLTVS